MGLTANEREMCNELIQPHYAQDFTSVLFNEKHYKLLDFHSKNYYV